MPYARKRRDTNWARMNGPRTGSASGGAGLSEWLPRRGSVRTTTEVPGRIEPKFADHRRRASRHAREHHMANLEDEA